MARRRLHVWLRSDVRAFDFQPDDFAPLRAAHPDVDLTYHRRGRELRAALPTAELVDCWYFEAGWYGLGPALRAVFTPAAGRDWVAPDPAGRVPTHYGTFHGRMIAESLLGLMLHFNRRIPAMLENQRRREWSREIQDSGRLLASQHVVLIGFGAIARHCARLLTAVGMTVTGCRRHASGVDAETGTPVVAPAALPAALARADHVVLLLPGGEETRGFLGRERLAAVKRGAHVYNFGRGTTLREEDLLWALDEGIVAGAGLDVTEVEPLPPDSRLWTRPGVLVLPHSSCVYDEYRTLHVAELIAWLGRYRP